MTVVRDRVVCCNPPTSALQQPALVTQIYLLLHRQAFLTLSSPAFCTVLPHLSPFLGYLLLPGGRSGDGDATNGGGRSRVSRNEESGRGVHSDDDGDNDNSKTDPDSSRRGVLSPVSNEQHYQDVNFSARNDTVDAHVTREAYPDSMPLNKPFRLLPVHVPKALCTTPICFCTASPAG